MIDCSRGNSTRNHKNQPKVLASICDQIKKGIKICGVMIESNLFEGRQDLPSKDALKAEGLIKSMDTDVLDRASSESPVIKAGLLRYGVSITDSCVDWTTAVEMMEAVAKAVKEKRSSKKR